MSNIALKATDIRKEYPGTLALDDVSVEFQKGKVHALLGKNGAGKSTLVKVIAGSVKPTSGKILINGEEVRISSPKDAYDKGIAIVYQELSLVPGLTVAENILLGRMPKKNVFGSKLIDWKTAYKISESVLKEMQVEFDVRKKVSEFSVAQQQVIEIAKAMSFNPSVLILDEPTSALARHETKSLFNLIKKLTQKNVAIIYISHRLQELREIVDTITVLRDGKYIDTVEMNDVTSKQIIHMMFGEIEQKERPTDIIPTKKPIMEVVKLTQHNNFKNINFTLYEGEVLGIAGMLGSGRTELLKAIFGAEKFDSGKIIISGEEVTSGNPAKMKELGLAFTPENRKEEALIQIHSIRNNMCMASMNKIANKGVITKRKEKKIVSSYIDRLKIKLSNPEHPVSSLSGGNQQKIVVGNWLATDPKVILFDEPTRGIDVEAKQQIFQIMWDLCKENISSIFVSTELEELVEVCHRILVIRHGEIVCETKPEEITPDVLFVMCMEEEEYRKQ
jgi:ribose transport system ATP-binding protein